MRLIEKLIAKRDAAHEEYVKWAGMVEVLQRDPDFASIAHYGATKVMQEAHALAQSNGNGSGNFEKRSKAARKGWSAERRKKYSAMLKQRNPMHAPGVQRRKKSGHQSPEYKAVQSARMKKLWREKRDVMLKGVAKGKKLAIKALKAKAAEASA